MTEEQEQSVPMEVELTKEEVDIIDFINDIQLELEEQNQDVIKDKVIEKFGNRGKFILEQLNEQVGSIEDDCEECGKLPDDWTEEAVEKMKILEDFLNDDLESAAQEVLDECQDCKLDKKSIREKTAKLLDKKSEEVTKDEMNPLMRKILFKGIVEGWLIDEYFDGE